MPAGVPVAVGALRARAVRRPARREVGDPPRTVGVDATAWEVLDVVVDGSRDRTSDDVAVVDRLGRCVGVVRLADLVRTLAESRVEEAAALNPLTRLPGSDAITGEVDRWIADGRVFALSRLDVDGFKRVSDGAGFAAGDELIRPVGRALQAAASGATRVGHIGGDDFLVLADPEGLDPLATSVLDTPWSAGGLVVTLSLATVLCAPGSVTDPGRPPRVWRPSNRPRSPSGGPAGCSGPRGPAGPRDPTRVGGRTGACRELGGRARAGVSRPRQWAGRRRGVMRGWRGDTSGGACGTAAPDRPACSPDRADLFGHRPRQTC